jgi:hypothetical protein
MQREEFLRIEHLPTAQAGDCRRPPARSRLVAGLEPIAAAAQAVVD